MASTHVTSGSRELRVGPQEPNNHFCVTGPDISGLSGPPLLMAWLTDEQIEQIVERVADRLMSRLAGLTTQGVIGDDDA